VWVIDTDYSLDDQLAICYLINKINIIAITVVGANTNQKPSVIKRKIEEDLVKRYNKPEIKVYAGADRPYINYTVELKDDPIFDPYNLKPTDYSSCIESETKESGSNSNGNIAERLSNIAAVKITELVRIYEKRLNILTLGPLTNLSLAVLIDSTIRDRFINLFICGGSFNNLGNSGTAAEYNFRVDPVASKNVIFYYKNVTLVPLELEEEFLANIRPDYFNNCKSEYSILSDLQTVLASESEETRSRHSLLGFFAAVIVTNLNVIKLKVTRPADVDIIGRYTRGALAIEKYEYLKSGKFNDVTILEELDLDSFKEVINSIVF